METNKEFSFTFQPKPPRLRPCTVRGEKALFHRWEDYAVVLAPSVMVGGHPGGQMREMFAIVELESGQVLEVKPTEVKFDDTREYMSLITLDKEDGNATD